MSILISTGSLDLHAAGPAFSVSATARELSKLGHNVTVFGTRPAGSDSDVRIEFPNEVRVHSFQRYGPPSWHFAPGIVARLIAQREIPKVDVALLQSTWLFSNLMVAGWCNAHGVPYIVSPRGTLNDEALRIRSRRKRIAWGMGFGRMVRSADCVHALTEAEARAVARAGLRGPVCVVPNGVDLDGVSCSDAWRIADRSSSRTVLYLGRLHKIKGLGRLFRAWAMLDPGDWQLVVCGRGPDSYEDRLCRLRSRLGIRDTVEFAGYVTGEAKKKMFRSAEIFVLPSRSEGLPMAALEAMAYRTNVVLSEACNLPEVFQYEFGYRCPESASGLATLLSSLMDRDGPSVRKTAERARIFAKRRFDWSRVAGQLESVCEWLLGEGSRPECVLEQLESVGQ